MHRQVQPKPFVLPPGFGLRRRSAAQSPLALECSRHPSATDSKCSHLHPHEQAKPIPYSDRRYSIFSMRPVDVIVISTMNELERITINPDQCGGRPCIRGMRIRVKDILDMLAGGATPEEILSDFPDLQPEDIRASLSYASRSLDRAA